MPCIKICLEILRTIVKRE